MRSFLKQLLHFAATLCIAPMLLSFAIRARLIGRDRALQGATEFLAIVPGLTGIILRRAFLARVLPHCASTATIASGVILSSASATLADHCYVGPYCTLGHVEVGAHALIAAGVRIPSGRHAHPSGELDVVAQTRAVGRSRVRIGPRTWIGTGAIVMADVGADTVVGAGAVVTTPLEQCVVAVGAPARVVRHRAPSPGAELTVGSDTLLEPAR